MAAKKYAIPSMAIFLGVAFFVIRSGHEQALAFRVALGFMGTIAVCLVAATRPWKKAMDLSNVGRLSLEIYVAHVLAAYGLMDVLSRLGLSLHWVIWLVIGTVAGVVIPIILVKLCRKLNFPWLFRLP